MGHGSWERRIAELTAEGRKWTEREAREVLAAWEATGESGPAFGRRFGIVPQRLWWWRSRLSCIRPAMGAPGALRKVRLAFQPSRRLTRSCSGARSASGGGWRAAVQTAPRGVTTLSTVKPEPRASFHL
jgi:hypothetical protein